MPRCAGCQAEIRWKYTEKGERMPLDAEPTSETGRGVYVLEGRDHIRPYQPMFDGYEVARYMNHWATCPVAEQFRKES